MPTIKQIIGALLLIETVGAFVAIFSDNWWNGLKAWNITFVIVIAVCGWIGLIIWLMA